MITHKGNSQTVKSTICDVTNQQKETQKGFSYSRVVLVLDTDGTSGDLEVTDFVTDRVTSPSQL